MQVLGFGSYISHIGKLKRGKLTANLTLTNVIDEQNHLLVTTNHTATHMLNFSIRNVLNDLDVEQKGSFVESSKFRFDFNYKRGLNYNELLNIENDVNKSIQKSLPLYTQIVSLNVAKTFTGIRAVFGEVKNTIIQRPTPTQLE